MVLESVKVIVEEDEVAVVVVVDDDCVEEGEGFPVARGWKGPLRLYCPRKARSLPKVREPMGLKNRRRSSRIRLANSAVDSSF